MPFFGKKDASTTNVAITNINIDPGPRLALHGRHHGYSHGHAEGYVDGGRLGYEDGRRVLDREISTARRDLHRVQQERKALEKERDELKQERDEMRQMTRQLIGNVIATNSKLRGDRRSTMLTCSSSTYLPGFGATTTRRVPAASTGSAGNGADECADQNGSPERTERDHY